MQQIEDHPDENKAWRECEYVVLHSAVGRMEGTLRSPTFIESLLDPCMFKAGPWVPVVHRDTLHLVHPVFTECEGEA